MIFLKHLINENTIRTNIEHYCIRNNCSRVDLNLIFLNSSKYKYYFDFYTDESAPVAQAFDCQVDIQLKIETFRNKLYKRRIYFRQYGKTR